jgi:hypothetical protein
MSGQHFRVMNGEQRSNGDNRTVEAQSSPPVYAFHLVTVFCLCYIGLILPGLNKKNGFSFCPVRHASEIAHDR